MLKKALYILLPVAIIAVAAYLFVNYQAKSLVDARLEELVATGAYQDLRYDSMRVRLNGDIEMDNLSVVDQAGNAYVLQHIQVSDLDYTNEVPHHLTFTATGLALPGGIPRYGTGLNAALDTYLDSLLVDDTIPLVMRYRYNFRQDEDKRLDSDFSFILDNAFTLTTTSVMTNVTLENLQRSPVGPAMNTSMMAASLQNASIPEASLSLEDRGAVNAWMAIQGESFGIGEDDYREQLALQLQTLHLFAPVAMREIAQEMTGNLIDFLEGGKTLAVSVKPELEGNINRLQVEIMSAMFIGDFERIVELLNLEIETR